MLDAFDRACPGGWIAEQMYPFSPVELERDEDECQQYRCRWCLGMMEYDDDECAECAKDKDK